MFDSVQQFIDVWRLESIATVRVLGALTDQSRDFPGAGQGRSLGEVAWHIVTALREIGEKVGIAVDGPKAEDPAPADAASIERYYRRAAASVSAVVSHWSDETLQQLDDVYGERWKRGETLFALLTHEIHHRGQLTLLLRQAGLRVPSVYGPSADESAPGVPR